MKKIFITMCLVLTSICGFAQKGEKALGLNLNYGSEIKNIGIGVKGQYNFTDVIRGEASFDYYFKKDYQKMWDINVNVHYLFPVADVIKVYPLAGLSYTNYTITFSDLGGDFDSFYGDESENEDVSDGSIGLNLGGGVQYDLNELITLNFELKTQLISGYTQVVFGVGAVYKF